jgi:hypothetical protein
MNRSEIPAEQSLSEQPLDELDERILHQVARLYDTVDPVPADLVERLQFAISLDSLNAELAELQQLDALSAARGTDEATTMTFTSESLTTMVTITEAGPDRVRIDGWCAPGGGAFVELRQVAATLEAVADGDGRFVFDDVSHGLTRFVVRRDGSTSHNPVITPAVEL